jgi:hypothetical protein
MFMHFHYDVITHTFLCLCCSTFILKKWVILIGQSPFGQKRQQFKFENPPNYNFSAEKFEKRKMAAVDDINYSSEWSDFEGLRHLVFFKLFLN